MQYGESTDVADRVRMTFESTDVQPRRQHGDRVETTERVRREYGQRGHSTDVLFKYGHSTDDVSLFKVRQLSQ